MPSTTQPGRTRTHNYLTGLLTGYAFTLTAMAVGLWMTPFTLRFLSREEFGLFTLGSDTLTWLSLLDFGITAGLRVKAAQLTGTSDRERMSWFASTALYAQSVVVLL